MIGVSVNGVISRFRFMAVAAGIMSLLLWFVEFPIVYLLDQPELEAKVKWIPFVHGYIYAFYVLTAIHYAARARWSVGKMIALILAGTLPIASFIAERRIAKLPES
jgi:integral membrane protein